MESIVKVNGNDFEYRVIAQSKVHEEWFSYIAIRQAGKAEMWQGLSGYVYGQRPRKGDIERLIARNHPSLPY
ncbi:hypothetical protein [Persicobacter diffluens]|uniref:Uncharacterized protein n=1 Tax=Persicobacter diffluens TaxID=981 RepID=A0AAN4W1D0_9BACT|nr:hypothetical protein PEDI_32670 [Persicobacter diffluens]